MNVCEEHQQLISDLAVIKRDTAENTQLLNEILKCIRGNGKLGLVTQTELNKSSILRVWWWLGGISLGILGITFFIIRSHL